MEAGEELANKEDVVVRQILGIASEGMDQPARVLMTSR